MTRERVSETAVIGILLIAIGLGLVGVCVLVYRTLAHTDYFEYVALALEKELNRESVSVSLVLRIVLEATLKLAGVAASVLVVVGVALHFGVHSALVVVTVTLIAHLLRPIITLVRNVPKRALIGGSRESLRRNL